MSNLDTVKWSTKYTYLQFRESLLSTTSRRSADTSRRYDILFPVNANPQISLLVISKQCFFYTHGFVVFRFRWKPSVIWNEVTSSSSFFFVSSSLLSHQLGSSPMNCTNRSNQLIRSSSVVVIYHGNGHAVSDLLFIPSSYLSPYIYLKSSH